MAYVDKPKKASPDHSNPFREMTQIVQWSVTVFRFWQSRECSNLCHWLQPMPLKKITTGLIYRSLGMDSVHDGAINQKGHIMICIVQMEKLRLVGVKVLNNFALVVYLFTAN